MTDYYSDVARLYNKSAGKWDRDKPTYRSDFEARPKLVELAAKLQPKTILDLGCGEGYVTRMLARATGANVVGVDLSPKLIEIAHRKERETPLGIDYLCENMMVDFKELASYRGIPQEFDLVTAAFSTHYLSLEDHKKLFKNASEITKNIVLATMEPESYWKTLKKAIWRTTYSDEGTIFRDRLKGGFWKRAEVLYVHRTRERMERDFQPFKIQERILIPCREAKFDFVVYQLEEKE